MTEQEQQILALARKDIQALAMDNCYQNLDMVAKVAGTIVAIAGGALLSVAMPGVGAPMAWMAGMTIAYGGWQLAGKEGEKIERGDVSTISQYVSESAQRNALAPYLEAITAAKKPLPQQVGQAQCTQDKQVRPTPSPEGTVATPSPEGTTVAGPAKQQAEQSQPPMSTGQKEDTKTHPQTSGSTSKDPMVSGTRAKQYRNIEQGALTWKDGEHLVMIGMSGSSKTTTLLQCVSKGLTLYLTLKTDDKAPTDWIAYRLPKFANLTFLRKLDDLCDVIERLIRSGSKHRLIVDEALSILDMSRDAFRTLTDKEDKERYKAVPARFEGLIKLYIRTGRSDGHYLGLVTQSPNGTDLFPSAKTMEGLKTVLCAGEASPNKFAKLGAWAVQLYGEWLTPKNKEFLASVQSGFWHFWLEGGKLHGAPTQLSQAERVPCPEFSLTGINAAIKAFGDRSVAATPAPLPDLSQVPADQVNWSEVTPHLLTVEGSGLKANMSTLLKHQLNGPTWQSYRDAFAGWLNDQPIELQVQLCDKYPSALPQALAKVGA